MSEARPTRSDPEAGGAPIRLTIQGLMVFVGLVGLILAAFRIHLFLGCLATGTLWLAQIRTSTLIDQHRISGSPLSPFRIFRTFLTSILVVWLVCGLALLPPILIAKFLETMETDATKHLFSVILWAVTSLFLSVMIVIRAVRLLWLRP